MNTKLLLAGLMVLPPAIHASTMHDWECNYIIENKETHELYYTDWYALQSDNSICFIDLQSGKRWLPSDKYIIHVNPNA